MARPLLKTKLYVPPVRPELVSRPRLIERLNAGTRSGRKLTLMSTPAGRSSPLERSSRLTGQGLAARTGCTRDHTAERVGSRFKNPVSAPSLAVA